MFKYLLGLIPLIVLFSHGFPTFLYSFTSKRTLESHRTFLRIAPLRDGEVEVSIYHIPNLTG